MKSKRIQFSADAMHNLCNSQAFYAHSTYRSSFVSQARRDEVSRSSPFTGETGNIGEQPPKGIYTLRMQSLLVH